jgi:hypothetical protein
MELSFTQEHWDRIKANAQNWWDGSLGRPLIQVRLQGQTPDRPEPALSGHEFASFYAGDVPVEQIVDRWDYDMRCTLYLGDAFPQVCPNFGPGVIAAFMGAELINGNNTVWFLPTEEKDLSELIFRYDPENKWLARCRALVAAALDRWQGKIQVALTDLGGNLDILSTFRPSEKLIYDLYDCPDRIKSLTWAAHELWWRYYTEFETLTRGINPGYSTWAGILSAEPHYMLQCDFCYMISPEMFSEFVQPELLATAGRLTNAFYHLDGKGQLAHLDALLAMDDIKGIQWVPGAGAPDVSQWPDVYRKITEAGKKIHISSNMCERPFEILDTLKSQLGRVDHVVCHVYGDMSQQQEAKEILERFDAQ